MKIKGNIDEIPAEFIWSDKAGLMTKELGKYAGSEKIYANLDSIPPKAFSTKYHSHSQQEEFFYVLSGRLKKRIPAITRMRMFIYTNQMETAALSAAIYC